MQLYSVSTVNTYSYTCQQSHADGAKSSVTALHQQNLSCGRQWAMPEQRHYPHSLKSRVATRRHQ
jgi:hypothetical protein